MISFSRTLAIALLAVSLNLQASDLAKEKRWADQIVDAILDGEAVWLDDGASKFLGIYTEVQPLRVGLIEHNWNTLSIQMPILPNEAEYHEYAPLYDEVAPRINAAIDYLQDNGSKEIVLLGHSQGATMSAYYLASAAKQDVKGFVAIGMGVFADDSRMDSIKSLQKIKVPVLDIYGDHDLEAILESTAARADAAKKAGNTHYTQVELADSNHFFDGEEEALIEAVADWLDKAK